MQRVLALTCDHHYQSISCVTVIHDYIEGKWLDPSLMCSFFHDVILCGKKTKKETFSRQKKKKKTQFT